MTPVPPRIEMDVSRARRINHQSLFSWQAQYLVKWRMTRVAPRIDCTGHFMCHASFVVQSNTL